MFGVYRPRRGMVVVNAWRENGLNWELGLLMQVFGTGISQEMGVNQAGEAVTSYFPVTRENPTLIISPVEVGEMYF